VTLISFLPRLPTLSKLLTPFSNVTNALTCVFGPGIQCAGFRLLVEELPLVVRNLRRRRPVPSVGRDGRSRCHREPSETWGMQQQMMPTAISMGEKQTRHQEAPIGSESTSPKMVIAQSMRRTARIVQLSNVSEYYQEVHWSDLQASKKNEN
jgi:hypothetical protein